MDASCTREQAALRSILPFLSGYETPSVDLKEANIEAIMEAKLAYQTSKRW
jgi:hypothetical protein